jgi:hypothetical protein
MMETMRTAAAIAIFTAALTNILKHGVNPMDADNTVT